MNMDEFDAKSWAAKVADDYGCETSVRIRDSFLRHSFCAQGVSPIETMLGCALVIELESSCVTGGGELNESSIMLAANTRLEEFVVPPFEGYFGAHQVKVGPYCVDFLIVARFLDVGTGFFAIECDGHEFHEKTKEQAAHDKKRDRYLQSKGLHVLRYTGAEVFADPRGVAASILENCRQALESRAAGIV